jgi:RNA polymerase sigma factor (sigma-70 family)
MNRVIHFLRRAVAPPGGDDDRELLRRFVAAREEAAFAGLVGRHGAMVFGVCRRVLDDVHDAEDAFQATFLVLARRASSVRKQGSLASWLYGVAYRVACKARAASALRRRAEERPVDQVSAPDTATEAARREVRPVIDEELNRLPEKYRAPLVLCYLEGKTNEEAARLLGWTKGTVSGRLARARDLLRPRLARRGLAIPAAGLAALFAHNAAAPAALVETTVRAALTGGAPPAAVALAGGVIRAMFATQAMKWTAVVTVLGLATAGTLWHYAPAAGGADEELRRAAADKEQPTPPKPGVLFALPEDPRKEPEDLPKLQGRWKAVALEHNGEKLSAEAVKGFRVAFLKDIIFFYSNNTESVTKFKLEPSSKPKVIWLGHVGADRKVEMIRGIYALEDDRLKICVDNDEGKATPTEFATKPGSGLTLMVLEREADGQKTGEAKPPGDKARLTLTGSGSPVRAVAFSPDGKTAYGCSEDGRISAWDVATGKARTNYKKFWGKSCLGLKVSPDGQFLAVVGTADIQRQGDAQSKREGGAIAVYDASSGKEIWMDAAATPVRAAAFSPDGRRVAAADDGRIKLRDAATGKLTLMPERADHGGVTAVAFSPDGKTLATGGGDKFVRLWDVATGKELRVLPKHLGVVTAVSFSPDGRHLLTACGDCAVQLWDVESGKEVRQWVAATKGVHSAKFSPDGKLIATGANVGAVALWDVATGKELASYAGHTQVVNDVAFSPDGKTLATASADGTVKLWDVGR